MSAESSDVETINEWTLLNVSGEDEVLNLSLDSSDRASTPAEIANLVHFQLESKLCDLMDDGVVSKNSSKEGSEASDIERISEDGIDNLNCVFTGRPPSIISNFSILNGSMDADTESVGDSSGTPVIQEDETRSPNYMHTPNRKANLVLNLLLVLSVTMVVGLGIGHFIGWSSRWMHARQIHQVNIAKLKALQEELVDCLQNPSSYYLETNGESKACYEKVDYWKKKFDDMLSENRVLQEFVDRTLNKADLEYDEEDEKCEEANKSIVAEYRQLKFHLINQQLENVATLRQVEALKRQEMETFYRVKQLEEENEELKAQVEEDSNADALKEAAEKAIIVQLAAENGELKQELNKLMTALKLEQEEDDKKTSEELWPLRQQINQLQVENSDLKHVIAKLRYGQPPSEPQVEKLEKKAPPRSRFANREPLQKPDNALHSWLVDNMKELNLTDFIEYLTKVAMDKEAARKELMHLEENLKLSYEQLSEKAKHGIDSGKTLLSDLQKSLHSKLEQIMNVDPSDIALPIEHIQKAGKTLKKTVEKMYEIGMDMLNTKEEDGPENDGNHKFKKQVDKLMVKFGKQWENIKSSVWGEKAEEESTDSQHGEEKEMHEKPNDDIFVAASREDHEKDKTFSHEMTEKEKKNEKNEQKKTTVNNDKEEEFSQKEKPRPTEESNKTEKQKKKDKKSKDKDVEKNRKNKAIVNKSSEKAGSEDKSKGGVNDKDKKSRKHHSEDAHEDKHHKKGKKENKLKEKHDDDRENDEEDDSKSKVNKSKRGKGKKKDNEKEFKQKDEDLKQKDESKEFKKKEKDEKDNDKRKDKPKESKQKEKDEKQKKQKGKRENSDKNRKINDKSTSSSEVNKKKNRKEDANNTRFNDEHSGDWMFQRADGRTTKRKSQHQSDWLFERAYDRDHIRREAKKSEWYFNKNKKEEATHGKSKKSNDDKEATKSNKKTNKMRKNQKHWENEASSNNEDSSNDEEEFMWSERHSRRHAYRYEYNVGWATPDSRTYYSSCS